MTECQRFPGILIVDDSPEQLRLLVQILEKEGYVARPITSGQLAIEAGLADPPDIVLLDINMPEMSGLEVCRRFKLEPSLKEIPIIFVSVMHDIQDKLAAFDAGGVDYIPKPFHAPEVIARVKAHLKIKDLQEALHAQLKEVDHNAQLLTKRMAAFSSATMDGLVMMDDSGKIVHWNAGATKIFGWQQDEVLDKTLHDLLAPERYHPVHAAAFPLFRATGGGAAVGKVVELHGKTKNGEEIPVSLSLATTKIDDKWFAVGILRDISEQRKNEDALRTSEERYRTLIDNMGEGLGIIDNDQRFVYANPASEKIFGVPSGGLVGRSVFDFVPIEDFSLEQVEMAHDKDNNTYEFDIRRPSGEKRTILVTASAPIMHGFDDMATFGIFRDITERKQTETWLLKSEGRYRALFESTSDAVMLLDENGFFQCNQSTIAMFGSGDKETFYTLHPSDLSPALQPNGNDSMMAAKSHIDAAMANGTDHFEWVHRRYDTQEDFHAEVLLTRMDYEGRNILLATVRNITERKLTEQRLIQEIAERKRIEVELRHSQKLEAVGQLAAGIAHEINTPTQFVGDSIHFIQEAHEGIVSLLPVYKKIASEAATKGLADPQSLDEITRIEEEIDLEYLLENVPTSFERCFDGVSRIAAIVRSMKEFAHTDSREKSTADINRALQATLTIAKNEYKYVADVETNFADLPQVFCHIGDLNQVFLNLIINGAHAIGDVVKNSGERGKISIVTRVEGDLVRIDISDTGTGIPEAVRLRVFDPFFTTKEVGKGSGQGLAIARTIVVEKHGGSLSFETESGKGTTFIIKIPIENTISSDQRRSSV